MANKIDRTLLNTLSVLAKKEKKGKGFQRRVRVRGKVIKKGLTKKGNIRLVVQKDEDRYGFVVIKTHKVNFALAEKLSEGSLIYAEGINKFRAIICTRLKQISKVDESEQTTLT